MESLLTIDIEELIPQRSPFIMVDRIIDYNESIVKSEFSIKKNNILLTNNIFCEGGIIENIAQTAAASVGVKYRMENTPVPVGFIGAVKKLKINNLPTVGSLVQTVVTTKADIMNAKIVIGEVFLNDDKIAQCELNIFLSDTYG